MSLHHVEFSSNTFVVFFSETQAPSPAVSPPPSVVRKDVVLWNPLTVRCKDRNEDNKRVGRSSVQDAVMDVGRDIVDKIKQEKDDSEDATMEDDFADEAVVRRDDDTDEESRSQRQVSLINI